MTSCLGEISNLDAHLCKAKIYQEHEAGMDWLIFWLSTIAGINWEAVFQSTAFQVALGGIIATIPVLLTNRHQAKEREKEREEARRQAHLLATDKVFGSNLNRAIALLEKTASYIYKSLRFNESITGIELQHKNDFISSEEAEKELDLIAKKIIEDTESCQPLYDKLYSLLSSIDNELVKEFKEIENLHHSLMESLFTDKTKTPNIGEEEIENLQRKIGLLRKKLREKKTDIFKSIDRPLP